ncbi:MAG: aminoacetone oxidase family FAD-binding enzyme, partial [Phycisphaerales bacterium]|nr:aminoacetone oxidase family FAD-binding enzyme [Phycisphaerales bacterium]
ELAYAGSSHAAIRQVLRHFTVADTIRFFAELGVELKREETGKLFPTTDRARTVLDALLRAARGANVELRHPWRVETIEPRSAGFRLRGTSGSGGTATLDADRVVLATGGRSLPKSGSDGHGFALARALGHSITPRVFPALVPLLLEAGSPLLALSGLTVPATLEVRGPTGKRLASFTDSLLCTHFGLSGPAALDISRYWTDAHLDDPGASLVANWLPGTTTEALEKALLAAPAIGVSRFLRERGLPERLATTLATSAGLDPQRSVRQLARPERRALVASVCAQVVPVRGDRGWTHAEVTAGGVPLSEVHLATLESRIRPGLFLCGEILDVDGRIGGFNFQWAWASGWTVGGPGIKASRHPGIEGA